MEPREVVLNVMAFDGEQDGLVSTDAQDILEAMADLSAEELAIFAQLVAQKVVELQSGN